MKKFSFNSIVMKQPSKGALIEAIWKSCHWDQHWHRYCKKIIFCLQEFFLKNRIFMFFLALSYGISTTLLQILISLRCPINSSKGVHWCSRKRLFELSSASVHWCFGKITALKVFAYFPAKQPGWSSFSVQMQAFLGFFQKALKNSYSVENLLAPASIKRNSTAHVISGVF